jgi:hypothetical protein
MFLLFGEINSNIYKIKGIIPGHVVLVAGYIVRSLLFYFQFIKYVIVYSTDVKQILKDKSYH